MAGNTRVWAAAAVAVVIAGGCGLAGGSDEKRAAGFSAGSAAPSGPEFEPLPESEQPSPAPSATSKKPTTKASTKPAAEQTQPAFWSELPACAHYDKTKQVAKKKVKAALKSAATRVYWRTEAPELRVSYPLLKAVAWQESGWQSNIHNCDGGAGVMQVMPDTVDMINNRFGLAYDPAKFQDNVYVGANYLAWLTKWVGDRYFKHSYDLSPKKCKSPGSWCLLNVVISGYNAGQGGLESAEADRTLPNPQYVSAVRALMSRCQCDQY
jgi:soluble lytic murein transglycosylase-like protein